MVIYPLIFVFIMFFQCKFQRNTDSEDFFDITQSRLLKGLLAFEIMLGHIGGATGAMALFPFRKAGILVVAMFFFLSGVGVMHSYNKKPGYMKTFLSKRLGTLLVSFWIANGIFVAIKLVFTDIGAMEALLELVGLRLVDGAYWFILSLALYYLFFYFCFGIFKHSFPKAITAMLVLTTIYTIFCYFLNVGQPWYGSCYGFVLGLCFVQYKSAIISFLNSKRNHILWLVFSSAALTVCLVLFFVVEELSFANLVIIRNMASSLFVGLFVMVLFRFRFDNIFLRLLAPVSMEIYYTHPAVIALLNFTGILENLPVVYTGVAIVLSILAAMAFSCLLKPVSRLLARRF